MTRAQPRLPLATKAFVRSDTQCVLRTRHDLLSAAFELQPDIQAWLSEHPWWLSSSGLNFQMDASVLGVLWRDGLKVAELWERLSTRGLLPMSAFDAISPERARVFVAAVGGTTYQQSPKGLWSSRRYRKDAAGTRRGSTEHTYPTTRTAALNFAAVWSNVLAAEALLEEARLTVFPSTEQKPTYQWADYHPAAQPQRWGWKNELEDGYPELVSRIVDSLAGMGFRLDDFGPGSITIARASP